MLKSIRPLIAFCLALALLVGCASEGPAKRLEDNVYAYAQAIRWSNYVQAANFMHPEDRPSPKQLEFQINRLENIRIVGYQELQQAPGPTPGTAAQLVELRIVNKHTLAERIIRDHQLWRYDEEANRWWLVSGLPDPTNNK